ncbi:MAG: hypothetical protein ACYDHP_07320 [Ferrimicrobium sp.]
MARELGCDRHMVNDAVRAYEALLVDGLDRSSDVIALGLDETPFP